MFQVEKRYTDFCGETEAPGTPGNPVVVIDAPCGAGKTSWAIDYMQHAEGPFMFVTPFNDEIDYRIVPRLAANGFRKPEARPTKRQHLIELLSKHHNIACTHELFRHIGKEAMELIQAAGYTLILDEVMQVLESVSIGEKDRKMLFSKGVLELQEDGKTVTAPNAAEYLADKDNRYRDVVRIASHDRLSLVNGSLLLWLFPAKVFACFHKAYNLTYLYNAQMQSSYYRLHGVAVTRKSVIGDYTKEYHLVDHSQDYDADFRLLLSQKVDLYQGKYNHVGQDDFALSKGWFRRAKKPALDSLGKTIRSYFRSQKGAAADVLWSVFGDWQGRVDPKAGARGFLACNARASNDYKKRSILAYCCNRYMEPRIVHWFKDEGCQINEDAFAASELIQWVCRSRIREGKPVSLLLPSRRMRGIYQRYLRGEYS